MFLISYVHEILYFLSSFYYLQHFLNRFVQILIQCQTKSRTCWRQ